MRAGRLGWVLVAGAMAVGGCQNRWAKIRSELGPAAEAVTASMQNLGWSQLPKGADKISFSAVVTTYDQAGKSYTDLQQMRVSLKQDTIVSTGRSPQGSWTVTASDRGKVKVKAEPGVDVRNVRDRMGPTLLLLLHRVRGPYNLVAHKERARSAERTMVAGRPVIRVGVGGDNRQAIAYYFDATNSLLDYVTAGADQPGRKGTVTVYDYMSLPDGLVFPKLLNVVEIGQHVLVGDRPALQVEISKVHFES